MKLTNKEKQYTPLIIPVDKPIIELTIPEAQAYFAWFVSHVDERAEYLRLHVARELDISADLLNYTFDSLIFIWRWFLQIAEISKTPTKVLKSIEKSLSGQPASFINHNIKESQNELSIFTEYVLRDIGMYVGKVFTTNFDSVLWWYKTKPKDHFVNTPLLSGFFSYKYNPPFPLDFDPLSAVRGIAMNLFIHNQKDDDLYLLCKKWENRVMR